MIATASKVSEMHDNYQLSIYLTSEDHLSLRLHCSSGSETGERCRTSNQIAAKTTTVQAKVTVMQLDPTRYHRIVLRLFSNVQQLKHRRLLTRIIFLVCR